MTSSFCCSSPVTFAEPAEPKKSRNAARFISDEMNFPAEPIAFNRIARSEGSANSSLELSIAYWKRFGGVTGIVRKPRFSAYQQFVRACIICLDNLVHRSSIAN